MEIRKPTMENLDLIIKNKFWQNKSPITGHTGFKGSWLSLWLKLLGAEICGVSLEPEKITF